MDDAVASNVAEAFELGALCAPPVWVARGAMGEIWRLVTTRGTWAVKALFEWSTYPALPEDVAVQQVARAAGIPLPNPVVVDGAAVQQLEGSDFRVYEWVDLDPPLSSPTGPARAAEAGSLLAKVHSLPLPVNHLPVEAWYTSTPPADEYRRLAVAASVEGRPWASHLRAAEPVIDQLLAFITKNTSPTGLCHRDFEPTNVLPSAGSGPLIVLDWENAGPLPQDQELVAALLGWTTTGGAIDTGSAEALLLGYRTSGGPAQLDAGRSFSMSAATALNFLSVMAEQALTDPEHRPFAEERLGQLLPDGLSDLLASMRNLIAAGLC